ncbi:MAG: acyclic terpene utilization AtuA family protein [Armatimonadetes bacterium]|nr:acyclic terpene utilization AtuA family protein [Armatimonadota bacterium]
MLGYGYPLESLRRGLARGVSFIGVDAGSTDPGPYYLGSGQGFVKPRQVRRDLEHALLAARGQRIPLIVGSAGGSGARPHVDAFLEILGEIARERALHFRLAVIRADVPKDVVIRALNEGRTAPCGPLPELTEEAVRSCTHLVGQMGTDPFLRALHAGADVVVAGRACDTAIFAALAIRGGFDPGLALHLAKIAECGALCARPEGANDGLLGTLRGDHFLVEPASAQRACTPDSVAAHSLYEQPDPGCFHEPEGKVDLTGCRFDAVDERTVMVTGSRLVPNGRRTVKLEGAALRGYRAVTIAGIRDPLAIAHLPEIEEGVRQAVAGNLRGVIEASAYSLRFLRYGLDGVMGPAEPPALHPPREVGLVVDVVAPTQDLAETILSLARATALHQSFPGRKSTAGNLAFPFSPSDLSAGAVYEFAVYHLLEGEDPAVLFPVEIREV